MGIRKSVAKKVAAKKTSKTATTKKKPNGARPVDKKWPVGQKFGVKSDRYIIGYHTGTDFECPEGTPVVAPFDGYIVEVSNSPHDYGIYMRILGVGEKREWILAHLSRAVAQPGHTVKKGHIVALSGNTGNTTGPHLHAEERHAPFGYRDCQKPTAWAE